MAIILNCGNNKVEKVSFQELDWTTVYNVGKENDKAVRIFTMTNDNYQNCAAHSKFINAEEMIAIYEYMKKIIETP